MNPSVFGRELTRRDFGRLAATGWAAALVGCAPPDDREPDRPTGPPEVEPGGPVDHWPPYRSAMVIDALASPGPFNVQDRIAQPLTDDMILNVRASGITAVNVTVSGGGVGDQAFADTLRHVAYFEREATGHPDVFARIRSAGDLDAARESERLGLILGFQDTTMFGSDIERVNLFYDLGVRITQLTYNQANRVGFGCLHPDDRGLTSFGRDVVARMNEIGMLVDLSHCGDRTTSDAIALSTQPVSITHSGCRTVFDHPRSKDDETLRAMAEGGGVVGIYMMPFLNAEGPAQTEHFFQHVEHAVDVCGEDHVGVGSDNSITPTVADQAYLTALYAFADERARLGIGAPREHEVLFVEGLNSPDRMLRIAEGLLERGHSETRVEKIIGGNFRRLFGEVWKT